MAVVTAKDCHAMTTYFIKLYDQKYGRSNVNRHAARWGFDSILKSMNMDEAKALVDYYFTTQSTRLHDIEFFFFNYHKLVDSRERSVKDHNHRVILMEESKKRAEDWRASGKQSITDN